MYVLIHWPYIKNFYELVPMLNIMYPIKNHFYEETAYTSCTPLDHCFPVHPHVQCVIYVCSLVYRTYSCNVLYSVGTAVCQMLTAVAAIAVILLSI